MLSWKGALAGAVLALFGSQAWAQQSATLDTIRARGHLLCGSHTGMAGFGQPDSAGVWHGLDVDLCRAVSAAIFGDATKVRFVSLSAQNRFTALQSGEVDMLSRNTTNTLSRDASLGLDFVGVNFYDGQGFMVKKASNITSAAQLDGATVCLVQGTTHEMNIADYFRTHNMTFTPVVLSSTEEMTNAYNNGRCDVQTADQSSLAVTRATSAKPEDNLILPEVISKEPLGPMVRQGDPQFADLVRWSLYAMVAAEELGLTSAGIGQQMDSSNPDIQRFVGKSGDLGQMVGVDNAWAYNIVKLVGSYGESFQRNLAPLGFQRGRNALWTQGGLMYAPPIR